MVSCFSFRATRHILTNFGGHLHTNIHSQLHQVFSLWFWCRARQSRWVTAEWQKRTTGSSLPLVPALSQKPKDIASVKHIYGGASDILQVPPKLSSTGLGLILLRKNIHNILEKSDWTPTNKHLPNIYSSATQRFGLGNLLHMWMSESCETLQRPILRPSLLSYNDIDLLIYWINKYNFQLPAWRHGVVATGKISITQWVTGWMSLPLKKQMERGWLKSCENSLWRISTSFNPISYVKWVKCNRLLFGNMTCPRSPRSLSLPHSSSLGRDAGTQMRVFSPSRISKSAPRQLLMTCEMSRDFFKHFCHKSVVPTQTWPVCFDIKFPVFPVGLRHLVFFGTLTPQQGTVKHFTICDLVFSTGFKMLST